MLPKAKRLHFSVNYSELNRKSTLKNADLVGGAAAPSPSESRRRREESLIGLVIEKI